MSIHSNEDETETLVKEKPTCRRERRASVQFIDKNLIRRRSSGNEKQTTQQRLIGLDAAEELTDRDHLQNYSENPKMFFFLNRSLIAFSFNEHLNIFLLFFFPATGSDSDSDDDDETGINIREMSHVSFD